VFGRDAYPTITEKAIALFHSLVSNHPFHDGNKRTAVSALYVFLLANGYYCALSNANAYEVAKAAASYKGRGLTHEQVLAEVREALRDVVIPFASLLREAKTSPSLLRTYEMAKKVRLLIRKDRLNRLISAE
jgi:Fic family protein